MNLDMITKWNKTVRPEDTIFSLGDFAWKWDEFQKYADQLNGNKNFIMGNHDLEGDLKRDINAKYHNTFFPTQAFFCTKNATSFLSMTLRTSPNGGKGGLFMGTII